MPLPSMQNILSSNLSAIGHEGDTLYVKFNNGQTWRYKGVSPAVYDELRTCGSCGTYLHRFIKPNHPGERVEDEPAPPPMAA